MKMNSTSRSLIVAALLLVSSIGSNGLISIYNLTSDPYESVSLYDEPDLEQLQYYFENRMNTIKKELLKVTSVQQSDNDNNLFNAFGGIYPWLSSQGDSVVPLIKRGEAVSNAPNIVFMLLDDVGINDLSNSDLDSGWLFGTTPNLAQFAKEGITLTNHFTGWVCGPSRAALMTGRYSYRLGYAQMPEVAAMLPLNESTLAQEFRSLGYRTAVIGKWHLGFEFYSYTPTFRGFDRFYGYYGGSIGYYRKTTNGDFLDLQDQLSLVNNTYELSNTTHLSLLLQSKVDELITTHVATYAQGDNDQHVPLFLYYSLQNVHVGAADGLEAPQYYKDKCNYVSSVSGGDVYNSTKFEQHRAYCALVIMFDESIGNTTCSLVRNGIENNTIIIIASDNGGVSAYNGVNYPYRGAKGSYMNGGVHNLAFIRAPLHLIPSARRGSTYSGNVHISDWFPTLLNLASNNTWEKPLNGYAIDGVDVWNAVVNNLASPRHEMVHNYDTLREKGSMQLGAIKYVIGPKAKLVELDVKFEHKNSYASSCFDNLEEDDSNPTIRPSSAMTTSPVTTPTNSFIYHTSTPTMMPTKFKVPSTLSPTLLPSTFSPTSQPSTFSPTLLPSTLSPTSQPSTFSPTLLPTTLSSTFLPSAYSPTLLPSTLSPTFLPYAYSPTPLPSAIPSQLPTSYPSRHVYSNHNPTLSLSSSVSPTLSFNLLNTMSPTLTQWSASVSDKTSTTSNDPMSIIFGDMDGDVFGLVIGFGIVTLLCMVCAVTGACCAKNFASSTVK